MGVGYRHLTIKSGCEALDELEMSARAVADNAVWVRLLHLVLRC